jgi:hypothetical protein
MTEKKEGQGRVAKIKNRNRVVSDSWQGSLDFAPNVEPRESDLWVDSASNVTLKKMRETYKVQEIQKQETHHYLLTIHYAKRIPPISFSFGLFKNDNLVGVCTYGMPASPSLCKGVAGDEWKDKVLELNRLALRHNLKNEASMLIGRSLQLLPKPRIIVSYADTDQKHIGVIYQATNWIYTGATKARNEITIEGLENLHSKAIANMGRWDELEKIYGNRLTHRARSVKHRYLFILGNKKEVKLIRQSLLYPKQPYPKLQVKKEQ